ncbi:MAG: GNAT family protein [Candidatus Paceibacterota bacterium]|jgi:RimJ/RimL family protein N-acetyltransferase
MKTQERVVFLVGKKVVLRPLNKETDLVATIRWVNDPEVTRYLNHTLPITEREECEWFDGIGKSAKSITLAIETKDDHKLIGSMGIHNIWWTSRVGTTGALIGEKEYWGRGYGTDAKMILLNYAFNTLNLQKICSTVIAFNKRSLHYSLHCGYKIEGRRPRHIFRNGRYHDLVELGLFKKDWLPFWKKYRSGD